MQDTGAYVQQIPAGARPPASAVVRPLRPHTGVAAAPPPGLYLQIADAADQGEAARASIAFVSRLPSNRPPFVRGVAVRTGGGTRIRMFAGPFADAGEAQAFCDAALPDEPCRLQSFDAPAASSPARGRSVRSSGR